MQPELTQHSYLPARARQRRGRDVDKALFSLTRNTAPAAGYLPMDVYRVDQGLRVTAFNGAVPFIC